MALAGLFVYGPQDISNYTSSSQKCVDNVLLNNKQCILVWDKKTATERCILKPCLYLCI